MLVVENNIRQYNYSEMSLVQPLQYFGDCIVVIDPSKTNMAVLVGDPTGAVLSIVEFSGNNRRKGPAEDTTMFCLEVRKYLTEFLANCRLIDVGVEQAVGYEGMNYYRSSLVLTEIRANILEYFTKEYRIKPTEINNWAWKSAVLPSGYRSRSEKGSKRWITDTMPNSPWANYFEADVTDVLCMYWYMLQTRSTYDLVCTKVEQAQVPFGYYFEPCNNYTKLREVIYNDRYSVMDNCNFYVNRILSAFCMKLIPNQVPIDLIYGHCDGFTFDDMYGKQVRMVIGRSG